MLVDGAGARQVPHYRAVDIASDNRVPPGKSQSTRHAFDATGCQSVTVEALVLYRPVPLAEARLRGWQAEDHVIASAKKTITVQ